MCHVIQDGVVHCCVVQTLERFCCATEEKQPLGDNSHMYIHTTIVDLKISDFTLQHSTSVTEDDMSEISCGEAVHVWTRMARERCVRYLCGFGGLLYRHCSCEILCPMASHYGQS